MKRWEAGMEEEMGGRRGRRGGREDLLEAFLEGGAASSCVSI